LKKILFFLHFLTSPLLSFETIVESEEAHYDGECITLIGNVHVENAMGTVCSEMAVLKKDPNHLTKIDFPWIELKSKIVLSLSEGGLLHCENLFLDYTNMTALIEGKPQVIYTDSIGEVYADRAQIDYRETDGTVEAVKVTLYDHVRLINMGTEEKPASQYALADIVYYFPPERTMILEGKQNRVLFYDTLRDIQLSARTVRAQRDVITKKESVQGLGDVRFVFGPDELNKIKTRFKIDE
jgi:hypothetical protein